MASKTLNEIIEDDWEWRLKDLPEFATAIGDHRYDHLLDERSIEAYEGRITYCKDILAKLETIDPAGLSQNDKVSLRLMQHHANCVVNGGAFRPWLCPINRLEGPHIELPQLLRYMKFDSDKDYENYIARLEAYPRQMTQVLELMRRGIKDGILPPAVSLENVDTQLQASIDHLEAGKVRSSPLWRDAPNPATREKLEQRAERALGGVQEAFRDLKKCVVEEYVPGINRIRKEQVGCVHLPNGREMYAECLRFHTGTSATPEEIHATGMKEVARIGREMRTACEACGLAKGGTHEDVKNFLHEMEQDDRFLSKTEQEHVDKYRVVCMRIMPNLPNLFSLRCMPRTPFAVIPTPKDMAEAAPGAYYLGGSGDGSRPGTFFVNTSKLDERPFYEAEALALHEAIPGHHTQTSLAAENEDLPDFRRFMDDRRYSEGPGRYPIDGAFIEGWGLYSESLGAELGLYTDPYQKVGQLSNEMFRACRLVVDTGLHAFDWTPERAMAFMAEHTATSAANIDAEVKRYCTWPGQATGYKMGELELQRLRKKFMASLGDQANIRDFHDIVLLQGVQPLYIIEEIMDEFIRLKKQGDGEALPLSTAPNGNLAVGIAMAATAVAAAAAFAVVRSQQR